jgi:5-methyltetrahydropteroyltriglutamate--homocysteine methyltransferase
MDNGKVIITCAITGGMTVPTQSEAIPVTVDEIVEAGVQAAEAGAAVLHIHVREEATGRPVQDPELFGRVLSGLSQRTNAVLQTTTGGGQGMTVEERGAIVPRFKPEMATLNAGSMNFGLYPIAARNLPFQDWEREYLESTRDYVFRNTFAGITYLAGLMRDAGTRPEIEIYDLGQLYNLRQLVNDGVVEPPFSLQFVLGVLGGSSSEPDHLMAPEPALVMDPSGRERPYPLVVGPIRRSHAVEVRDMEFLRANTDKPAKMTLPGPFTISKQMKNEFYSDEDEAVMDIAAALNEEVRALVAAGADVIQLDEPWLRFDPAAAERIAIKAIDRALDGVSVTTVIHLCFGYAALVKGEKPAGYAFLPQLADSVADQISIESAQPDLDLGVLADLAPKNVILGVINLADPAAETADDVARRIRKALGFIEPARLIPGPDCGMKYLPRETAFAKLRALADGASQVRRTV